MRRLSEQTKFWSRKRNAFVRFGCCNKNPGVGSVEAVRWVGWLVCRVRLRRRQEVRIPARPLLTRQRSDDLLPRDGMPLSKEAARNLLKLWLGCQVTLSLGLVVTHLGSEVRFSTTPSVLLMRLKLPIWGQTSQPQTSRLTAIFCPIATFWWLHLKI